MKHRLALFGFLLLAFCSPVRAGFTAPGAGDHCYGLAASGTTANCVLTNAPSVGKVVAVMISHFSGLTLSGISDGTTSYVLPATHCSATNDATAGTNCVAYLIPAITGGQSITASFTGGTCSACSITVDVFGVTGGTASFNSSAAGAGTGAVTTPTITVSGASTLLWGGCSDENSCTGVSGAWTAEANGVGVFGELAEYQLSVSSNTAVGFTGGGVGQHYDSMGMAFSFTPSGATIGSKLAGATKLAGPAVIH